MPEQIETASEWVLSTCVNDGHVTAALTVAQSAPVEEVDGGS